MAWLSISDYVKNRRCPEEETQIYNKLNMPKTDRNKDTEKEKDTTTPPLP